MESLASAENNEDKLKKSLSTLQSASQEENSEQI